MKTHLSKTYTISIKISTNKEYNRNLDMLFIAPYYTITVPHFQMILIWIFSYMYKSAITNIPLSSIYSQTDPVNILLLK